MKLLQFSRYNHNSCDYRLSFINIKKYSLFQISADASRYFSMPFLQITIGGGSLIELFVIGGYFSFDIEFFGHTWQKHSKEDGYGRHTFLDGILSEKEYRQLVDNGMMAAYFGGEILIEEIYAFLRDQGE